MEEFMIAQSNPINLCNSDRVQPPSASAIGPAAPNEIIESDRFRSPRFESVGKIPRALKNSGERLLRRLSFYSRRVCEDAWRARGDVNQYYGAGDSVRAEVSWNATCLEMIRHGLRMRFRFGLKGGTK